MAGVKGMKRTPEHNRKIGDALRGVKKSVEACANLSKAKMGKKGPPAWNKGEKHTPETIAKMRVSHMGNRPSAETRKKRSLSMIKGIQEGRIHPERSCQNGDFYSSKNRKTLHYRSQLELHWYRVLETLEKVHRYYVEPCVIPYEFGGFTHHYLPDLRIRYTDGTTELVEVKPESQWDHPLNRAKFNAAIAWCKGRRVPTTFKVVGYKGWNRN